jgi:hypothetical protein
MKKVLIALLLLAPALSWAGKPKPNPADYTITVHVQSSFLTKECAGDCPMLPGIQHLIVVIDGKKYELDGAPEHPGVLRVGDYKAKLLKQDETRSYEFRWTYEFLFPDGKTRDFLVVSEAEAMGN